MARGRKPSVRYWESRKAYCCWIGADQHVLARGPDDAPNGPTYLEAHARFRKLVEREADKGTDDYLVSALLNQYRAHLAATRKSGVPGVFEVMARGFAEEFGKYRVRELKPHMVEGWLARQSGRWNSTSRAHAGTLILAAVSWARKKGFIQTDPLAGRVDLPQPVLRGREARMSEGLMDLLIGEARANKMRSHEFADLLWALRLTGARPGELRHAQAFNYERGRLVFRWNATRGYVWKNAKKTQRDRVILLTPELQEHVERLVVATPDGPIFRTPRDAPWSLTSVSNKWQWLLKRPKVVRHCEENGIEPRELRVYNFRHSWACNYLDTTGDIFGAALMLGTSVKMLQTRYFHMDMDKLHERFLSYHRRRAEPAA